MSDSKPDRAHRQGYEAYQGGRSIVDNPYVGKNKFLAKSFREGYMAAQNVDMLKRSLVNEK